MDVFDYIASNEPRKANQVIMNYGYRINSPNLAQSLRDLVNYEGEDAMHDLMLIHPDHEYFLSLKSKNNLTKKKDNFSQKFAYLNAVGNNQNQNHNLHAISTQTNVFIFVGAMLLAAAIITKK